MNSIELSVKDIIAKQSNIITETNKFNNINSNRLFIITSMLKHYNIPFRIQKNKEAKNIIISLGEQKEVNENIILLGAHYDIVPNSLGINDNTVAVSMLIEVAKEIINTKKRIDIVFFDREETGFYGSKLYIDKIKPSNIKEAYIFDVIGFGDTVALSGAETKDNKILTNFLESLSTSNKTIIGNYLASDNINFIRYPTIPVVLTVVVPNEDILVSKSPYSIDTLKGDALFYSSFHNRRNDNKLDLINWKLANKLKKDLVKKFLED